MRFPFRSLALSFLLAAVSGAAPVSFWRVVPNEADAPAEQRTLELALLNADAAPTRLVLPPALTAEVDGQAVTLKLLPADAPARELRAGAYQTARYTFSLPTAAGGAGVVRITDTFAPGATALPAATLAAAAAAGSPVNGVASAPAGGGAAPAVAIAPDGSATGGGTATGGESRPQAMRDLGLSFFEPMYFSFGFNDRTNARFQLSVRYRPFGPSDYTFSDGNVFRDLYFTYTQTSVWDLESESKPFFDTSYRPAISYYRYDFAKLPFGGRFGWAGGLEHESNGQGGAASRSINIAFLRPELTWGDRQAGWFFQLAPKVFAYLEKSENDDIEEFRGYGDYRVVAGEADGVQLATTFRVGTSGKASVLADLTYPFARINDLVPLGWVHGFLHVQYFDGYGETLRTYNQNDPWQLRIGYMLVR